MNRKFFKKRKLIFVVCFLLAALMGTIFGREETKAKTVERPSIQETPASKNTGEYGIMPAAEDGDLFLVTLDPNGGTSGEVSSFYASYLRSTYNISELIVPTREGYTFLGWYDAYGNQGWFLNANGKCEAINGVYWLNYAWIYAGNSTFYAKWELNSYNVQYYKNKPSNATYAVEGTTKYSTHTYNEAKALTTNGFTLNGWEFVGWNTEADGSGTSYSDKESVKNLTAEKGSTVTLYAQWKPYSYNVQYYKNKPADAVNAVEGDTSYSTHTYDTAKNLPKCGFTLKGWTFTGWNTEADGSGTTYTDEKSVKNLTATKGGTVTLYAQWRPNVLTIRYHANGSSMSSDTYYLSGNYIYANSSNSFVTKAFKYTDTSIDVTSTSYLGLSKKGYHIDTGQTWRIGTTTGTTLTENATSDATILAKLKSYIEEKDTTITLYANWQHNAYTVTYKPNGGTTTATTATYYYGDAISLAPTASKPGYTFIGWAQSPTATTALESLIMPDLATSTNPNYSSDWELSLYAVYTVAVSDVENHNYPNYTATPSITDDEVYLLVWLKGNPQQYKTYPLTYTKDSNTMKYSYSLTQDISSFVGTKEYLYQIIAYDNVGNRSVLYDGSGGGPKPPEKSPTYTQTVRHYYYETNEWFYTTQFDDIEEGTVFTPAYITAPDGYEPYKIDAPYVVNGSTASYAYYKAKTYTLYFDVNANGDPTANVNPTSKSIAYKDYYGDLPTPTRTGYTFQGWFTKPSGGEQVKESHIYTIADDSTLYAQWKINSCTITYDYWTNGGNSVSQTSGVYPYGTVIDLSKITAKKEGWEFVGWNTEDNQNATEGLDTFTVTKDETLYAIYKKPITITIYERDDTGIQKQTLSATIYNTDTGTDFEIDQAYTWTGWKLSGFTTSTDPKESPDVSVGSTYPTSNDTTLYGVYSSDVTITYDTNGSLMEIEPQTDERFYNAYKEDNYAYPSFVIANAPALDQHSFVEWADNNGKTYEPEQSTVITESTTLKAVWDKFPEIEAYDRYFTLEKAQSGEITKEELLSKVTGSDLEDGTLINGKDVIVLDYNASAFLGMTETSDISITYQATDSFGNAVTKTITVYVVDTTVKELPINQYIRFISNHFFELPAELGGLESNSIWRNNIVYHSLLDHALSTETPLNTYTFTNN